MGSAGYQRTNTHLVRGAAFYCRAIHSRGTGSPNAIIGYADTTTYIYTVSKLPTYLFWGALLLFVVGLGVLIGLKIKRWKGKTHDGQD